MLKKPIVLFLLILALGAFLRFFWLFDFPPGLYPDEAMNGNNALEALATGDFKFFYPENNGREGFFINLQALSVWLFGNEPWALRGVSALFGTLTILGVWLLAKELFPPLDRKRLKYYTIPLLASFFLATSFWHINFSRIGFRAISVPFFTTFGLYFLLKGLRKKTIWDLVFAGVFMGLGFHTYIAFRFMPFVLAVPLVWYLWEWKKGNKSSSPLPPTPYHLQPLSCTPCAVALFLLVTFVTALPIGYYFLTHPEDFAGRSTQVSIFAAESPLKEFLKSVGLTAQMFFWSGDCNPRHNYLCAPQLHPIISPFFAIGLFLLFRDLFRRESSTRFCSFLLAAWLLMMSFPATLTREGLPHALRAIGMIPPVFIITGMGTSRFLFWLRGLLEQGASRWKEFAAQLLRIRGEATILLIASFLLLPLITYRDYFLRWSGNEHTFFAFATDLWHLGQFLDRLPDEKTKYVAVNLSGVEVRGIPMPAQTVMFATDSFREEGRKEKHIVYLLPHEVPEKINPLPGEDYLIALLKGDDRELLRRLQNKFPELKPKAPGDFVILEQKEGFANTDQPANAEVMPK